MHKFTKGIVYGISITLLVAILVFSVYQVFMKKTTEELLQQTDSQKAEYKDYDSVVTITVEFLDSKQLVFAGEFIKSGLNTDGVDRYTFEYPKENTISVTFGFNEDFDMDGFYDRLSKEIPDRFADLKNINCWER